VILNRRNWLARAAIGSSAILSTLRADDRLELPNVHPRVLITPELIRNMARKVRGPYAAEYKILLETASLGPQGMENRERVPGGLVEAGLAYLIERELGRDGSPYAEQILQLWRRPEYQKPGLTHHFGWNGLLYDWIYDAMTPTERAQFGELLGEWVATWWGTGEVSIPKEGWWYNQHWGPGHLDVPNHRVALTAKLFMSAAALGNGGKFDDALRVYLRSFQLKYQSDGIPALEQMGGIWSESNGHGGYGPLLTVPLGMEAARTVFGIDAFQSCPEDGFAREYMLAAVHSMMPHNMKVAYIDDSQSGYPEHQARIAPVLAHHFHDPMAKWLSDTALERSWLHTSRAPADDVWTRIAFMPEGQESRSPRQVGLAKAHLFRGAGHVYMRSAWDDPNSTWAFFGAGPSYASHSRDDEGHFLIARRGHLVNRSGGAGHNDNCYYSGGSLVYNVVTIYHPGEKMRRTEHNENDGGMLRYIYTHGFPMERGHITGYFHEDAIATYAAADLTRAYWTGKTKEVTRQFLYLRGEQECFVIFDRVESTNAEYPKVWFLHVPTEPKVSGTASVQAPGHAVSYDGGECVWAGSLAGDTGSFATGQSWMLMQTLAPSPVRITKRGGPGHDFWGHPHNPAAQYNHVIDIDGKEDPAFRMPPLSPWRLEVEPVTQQERDYFLHVLFLSDQEPSNLPPATRIEADGRVGARISLGARTATVLFDLTGPAGAKLKVTERDQPIFDAELPKNLD
jgi:hypothetical protein